MCLSKPAISVCAVLLGVVVVSPPQVFAQTQPATPPAPTRDLSALAKADVAKAEQELAKIDTRVQQSQAPQSELSEAKIRLAEARLQLAQMDNQSETVIQQAQIIVDERTQILSRLSVANDAGVVSRSELNAARLALAEARVNLDLYTLIGIKRENTALALRLYNAGAGSKDEINQASQPAALGRIQTLLSTELNAKKNLGQQP